MVDILIYECGSGGELFLIKNDLQTIECCDNQVYLALWGGNLEANTIQDSEDLVIREDWWGNQLMEPKNQFNSETERTLDKIVLNSQGMFDVENAVKKDLKFLEEYYDINIFVKMINYNALEIEIDLIELDKKIKKFIFICKEKEVTSFTGQINPYGIGVMIIENTFKVA